MKKSVQLLALSLIALAACEREHVEPDALNFSKTRGVYICCEGNFLYGNASLSFYDIKNKRVYSDVFFQRNQVPLGDVAQSLNLHGDNLFIVVNNSGKVVAVDINTAEFRGTVKGLVSPREMLFVSDRKAYVSDMMARKISVLNPGTFTISKTIGVSDGKAGGTGHSTESFAQVGNYVFVTCWVSDSKILVIDSGSDAVVDSIEVPFQPNKILIDAFSKIWVQTDGEYFSTTGDPEKPALVRLDPVSRKVEKIFRLKQNNTYFTDIRLNPSKDSILYLAGDLFKMSVKSDQLPDKGIILTTGHSYYGFGVDPVTGEIYLGDAMDYSRNGNIYRFTSKGLPVDTFSVGICPGDFLFKN
jgi:DNA-binding beta-propeller fold protein YncE